MKKLFTLFAAMAVVCSAWALDIDTAKSQGIVGEQQDGYLGLVVKNSAAEKLVTEVNAQRKIKYQEIAVKRGTQLSAVEKFAGSKLTEKAMAEKQFYQNENGKWAR